MKTFFAVQETQSVSIHDVLNAQGFAMHYRAISNTMFSDVRESLTAKRKDRLLSFLITYRAKLLNPDWLRQRAFFLNHEGTFGNQEGMIT